MWVTPHTFCKRSLLRSSLLNHSLWVTRYLSLPQHVSSHNQQHVSNTSFSRQSHYVSSHDQQQGVSATQAVSLLFCQVVSSCLFPWPTGCEWHCIFVLLITSHHMPTGCFNQECEWLCIQVVSFSRTVPCHDQQMVSDTAVFILPGHLTMSHAMTNRGQVTCIFLFPGRLIISLVVTNSMWVTFSFFLCQQSLIMSYLWPSVGEWHCICFFCQAVSLCLIPWSTGGEWQPFLFARQFHHVIPWTNKQGVSDTAFLFWQDLMMSHPMTTRMWVTLHILFCQVAHRVSSTACEWYCTSCARLSSHVSSHDQQVVSGAALCLLPGKA